MLLRYLALPDYGVLKDLKVRFERDLLFQQLPDLSRKGSLHFVVGLNGTGKSSLLRALNETFRWLDGASNDRSSSFPFPVSLVYDLTSKVSGGLPKTCIFYHPGHSVSRGFFFIAKSVLDEAEHGDWEGWVSWLREEENWERANQIGSLLHTSELKGDYRIAAALPDPLLVYTSGSTEAWTQVTAPELPDQDLVVLTADQLIDERPRGWDVHRELSSSEIDLADSERTALREFADPNNAILGARCRLLKYLDLKLAAVTIGLCAASGEASHLQEDADREEWRRQLLAEIESTRSGSRPENKTARVLLNEVDWWFPSHLTIEYRQQSYMLDSEVHAELLVLCIMATEAIQQPLQRVQLVVDLGPRKIDLWPEINAIYADRAIPLEVKEVAKRVEGASSGAEAVIRILCTAPPERYEPNVEPSFARWPVFDRLHCWRTSGVIEDINVTIKRIAKVLASDGELDDSLVSWSSLSDGEQMLLGRMSLLLLLCEQDGSLLLLDEPETHFNDSWNREIIDFVDDSILKTTNAHVLVATHTSIALTDVFASEIIRLVRSNGKSVLKNVKVPTFGASPARIMTHVFDMPNSIGSRAEQILKAYMGKGWKRTDIEELETLLANIGNGWPMAKLQKSLEELTNATSDS
jgi:ABC-type cobalamin/Fe3+-siderophores transport system ATPase subunit